MQEDEEPDENEQHLLDVQTRLREQRIELARTVRALRQNRRTPRDIRQVIQRAKSALYRAVLLRRKLDRRWRIH